MLLYSTVVTIGDDNGADGEEDVGIVGEVEMEANVGGDGDGDKDQKWKWKYISQ